MILNNDSYFEILSYIASIGFVSFKIYCKLFVLCYVVIYLCYVNQYNRAMKRVIKITEEGGKAAHYLKLSEAGLISKILQDSPDIVFTVQLVSLDKSYYNTLFGL